MGGTLLIFFSCPLSSPLDFHLPLRVGYLIYCGLALGYLCLAGLFGSIRNVAGTGYFSCTWPFFFLDYGYSPCQSSSSGSPCSLLALLIPPGIEGVCPSGVCRLVYDVHQKMYRRDPPPQVLLQSGFLCVHVTGERTSGIVEVLGPSYRYTYQRHCGKAGAKGSAQKRATPRRATNSRIGRHRPEKRPLRQVTHRYNKNTAGVFAHALELPYGVSGRVVRQCGRRGLRWRGVRGRGKDPTVSCPRSLRSSLLPCLSSSSVGSLFLCERSYRPCVPACLCATTQPQRTWRLPFSVQTDQSTGARTGIGLKMDTTLRHDYYLQAGIRHGRETVISSGCSMVSFFSSGKYTLSAARVCEPVFECFLTS